MKQTAVEWLVEQLKEQKFISESQIHIAKLMEKQQIITAYNKAVPFKYGKEYYEETYNLSQQDKP